MLTGALAPLFKQGSEDLGPEPFLHHGLDALDPRPGEKAARGEDQRISGLTPSFTTTFMPLKLTTCSATILQRLRVST